MKSKLPLTKRRIIVIIVIGLIRFNFPKIAVFERSVSYCQFGYSELLVLSIILII
nr:MAG TPA: hypothetical protein [Caudoviricetes sp.]DAU99718.1 MAG TPA: hypothetical protein [Caudoviricetes sp.]